MLQLSVVRILNGKAVKLIVKLCIHPKRSTLLRGVQSAALLTNEVLSEKKRKRVSEGVGGGRWGRILERGNFTCCSSRQQIRYVGGGKPCIVKQPNPFFFLLLFFWFGYMTVRLCYRSPLFPFPFALRPKIPILTVCHFVLGACDHPAREHVICICASQPRGVWSGVLISSDSLARSGHRSRLRLLVLDQDWPVWDAQQIRLGHCAPRSTR